MGVGGGTQHADRLSSSAAGGNGDAAGAAGRALTAATESTTVDGWQHAGRRPTRRHTVPSSALRI
ncbi:MAG: hypothetical protein ACK559_38465 [bacterium]